LAAFTLLFFATDFLVDADFAANISPRTAPGASAVNLDVGLDCVPDSARRVIILNLSLSGHLLQP